jgi:hypothetical protein
LPECISTKNTKTTAMATWMTDRIVSTPQDYRVGRGIVLSGRLSQAWTGRNPSVGPEGLREVVTKTRMVSATASRSEQMAPAQARKRRPGFSQAHIRPGRDTSERGLRHFRLRCRYGAVARPRMETEPYTICQRDYESFTDSCLPADMNCGGRARLWASCADHDHGTTPR